MLRVRRVSPSISADTAAELQGACGSAAQRGGGLRGRASQVRQRLARPVTARRDRVDARLSEELTRLDERVRALTAELDRHRMASHAEVLAQFRRMAAEARADGHRASAATMTSTPRADTTSREVEHHLAEHEVLPFMASGRRPCVADNPVAGRVLGYEAAPVIWAVPGVHRRVPGVGGSGSASCRSRISRCSVTRRRCSIPAAGAARCWICSPRRASPRAGSTATRAWSGTLGRRATTSPSPTSTTHLRGLPEGQLGGIVSLEVVEHMPADALRGVPRPCAHPAARGRRTHRRDRQPACAVRPEGLLARSDAPPSAVPRGGAHAGPDRRVPHRLRVPSDGYRGRRA